MEKLQKCLELQCWFPSRKGNASAGEEHRARSQNLRQHFVQRNGRCGGVGGKALGVCAPRTTEITAVQMVDQAISRAVLRKIKALLKIFDLVQRHKHLLSVIAYPYYTTFF